MVIQKTRYNYFIGIFLNILLIGFYEGKNYFIKIDIFENMPSKTEDSLVVGKCGSRLNSIKQLYCSAVRVKKIPKALPPKSR